MTVHWFTDQMAYPSLPSQVTLLQFNSCLESISALNDLICP